MHNSYVCVFIVIFLSPAYLVTIFIYVVGLMFNSNGRLLDGPCICGGSNVQL